MALTTTEEAQLRALLVKQTELLSLAASEPAIISELGAGDTTFPELISATVINDADLLLVRQGTEEKSSLSSVFAQYVLAENAVTQATNDSTTKVATTAFSNPGSSLASSGWHKLPSGLIIQWGLTTSVTITSSQAAVSATLPIAFPNNFFKVICSAEASQAGIYASIVKNGLTAVNGVINNSSASPYTGSAAYIAIGN